MWWTADPPRPFQLRPVPICSALRFLVAGLLPAFIYRRFSRLSQGTASSYRVTLMVRPLLLAEPGPGDASCTTWTLSVFFRPLRFRAGRPSSRLHSVRLQSCDCFRPFHLFRSFDRFQFLDLLRSRDRFRPSCNPNLSVGGLLSNGGLKLLLQAAIVKLKNRPFSVFF